MNKRVLLGMTLMASLAFYSCTKEIVIVQEGGEGGIETPTAQDGQVLTLQVANSGDGLTTRAGRPLLSSQAKQDINTVILYVVSGHSDGSDGTTAKDVVLKKTINPDEWANALDYTNGKQLQITFRASDKQKLTAGNYTIYAVGYKTETTAATSYKVTDADFGVTGTVVPTEVGQEDANAKLAANNFSAQLDKTYNNSKIIPADEIFAGVVEVTATEDYLVKKSTSTGTKVVPALVLNRQVAGVTGYFTNLPAKVGTQIPAKIRLVASGKSNKVHFTSMLPGETGTDSSVKNVVNGSWSGSDPDAAEKGNYWDNSKEGYIVYEIDLKSFFPMIGSEKTPAGTGGNPAAVNYTFADMDLDGDGFVGYKDAQYYVYDLRTNIALKNNTDGGASDAALEYWEDAIKGGTDNITVSETQYSTKALSTFWKNPNEKTQTLVAGSVFAGEFILPFLQVTSPSNVNTFELQLLDKDDNILKNWNIQVDKKVENTHGSLATGITGSWSPDASNFVYNVYRNHLYSLGLKTTNIEDGKDPSDPETPVDPKPNPDPDPDGGGKNPEDQPEDLSKGQDLLINVNDNWEIIHNMVID